MENEFGYFSKDVAEEVHVTPSTLRRWSIALEAQGYSFQRNEQEQRVYYERDFKAFRELKKLLAHKVRFVDAIKAIATRDLTRENKQQTPSVYSEINRLSMREVEDIIKTAIQEEREVLLEAFNQKLADTLETRDQLLVQQLQQTIEGYQQQILALSQPKEKKSWWKVFKNR